MPVLGGEIEMGKYSAEEDVEFSKIEIAKAQLEAAIDLFLNGDRLSAITLAGAADLIFSSILGKTEAPAEEAWREIEKLRQVTGLSIANGMTKSDAMKEWNHARNRLKHNDPGETHLRINLFDESYMMIQRANLSGDRMGVRALNRDDYENWLMENIYL